jgi:hypothetical protein
MKPLLALAIVLAPACAASASAPMQVARPDPPRPQDPMAWLAQLAGEWTVTAEFPMGPDQEPVQMTSTESVRMLGDAWYIAESDADMGGTRVQSVMTVGYDTQTDEVVGTWIDTMQPHLWVYRGWLDESGRKLTLEAEGPAFDDPSTTALYRDAIEIVGPDHKVLTSSVQGPDGEWVEFLRADAHRR